MALNMTVLIVNLKWPCMAELNASLLVALSGNDGGPYIIDVVNE